jgi:Putative transposase
LFVIHQAGLTHAQTGAVTLIQRFGSAAKLNIHLHCLMLDGVYRLTYELVELGRVEHYWCSPGAALERFGARVYHGPQQLEMINAPSSNCACCFPAHGFPMFFLRRHAPVSG